MFLCSVFVCGGDVAARHMTRRTRTWLDVVAVVVSRRMDGRASSKRCCQMQCSGSGCDAGRSGIASTDSDSSGVNYKPHRRRSEHRHRRKWFAPEWSTHGHSACQSVAAPQGAAVRDMRCCGCGCGCGWLLLQHTPVGPSTKAAAPCVCAMRVLRQQQQLLLLHPTECSPSASCSCELVASW